MLLFHEEWWLKILIVCMKSQCKTLFLLVGLVVLMAASLQAATVAHWRFESDGFYSDSGPGGHTLSNRLPGSGGVAATAYVLPATGKGSEFAGEIPQTGATNAGAASFSNGGLVSTHASGNNSWNLSTFTIEAYFNLSTIEGIRTIAGQLASERRWLAVVNGGKLTMILQNASGTESSFTVSTMNNLAINTDYYMAISVDVTNPDPAQRLNFYLKDLTTDGPLLHQTQTTSFTDLRSSNAPFSIGATGNPSSPFSGIIDEVRFSDTVLGANELLIAPEPGRMALVVAGAMFFFVRRSRRMYC